MPIHLYSQMIESNGKTVRENNLAISHKIPVGTLVQVTFNKNWHGQAKAHIEATMYVITHDRDCDGEPLYGLATTPIDQWLSDSDDDSTKQLTPEDLSRPFSPRGLLAAALYHPEFGFSEAQLKVIGG